MRLLWIVLLLACKKPEDAAPTPSIAKPAVDAGNPMTIETPGWFAGANIPALFTCDGGDKNPQIRWSKVPKETKSYLLIVDDPDAPSGTFTHFVMFDIPAESNNLPEGEAEVMRGTIGKNDFGNAKWNGPCPPKGKGEHRYFFRLHALDIEKLGLAEGASRGEVEKKIDGHVLAKVETMGRYGR
jgi:Raf kinase inhibitor-like YbhB/YbcL family protein